MKDEKATPRPFQVDLRGVVDLLSRHIYSSPRVYLRELLQNGVDAITARRALGGTDDAQLGIKIYPLVPGREEFTLVDDGIGLTAAEVEQLLATVGGTSKRDIFDMPRSDYLGQFGIGLLSCFMVSDQITIRTQSATGGPAVEWTGSADGTFTIMELAGSHPVGTSVILTPRFDTGELLSQASVGLMAREYGEFLPIPIDIVHLDRTVRINREPVFAQPHPDQEAIIEYGREIISAEPFDAIELSAPGSGTTGVAYVLPYAPPPSIRQANRVYLGGMLLSDRTDEVLPDWAFFTRAVINSTGLNPTASREDLVNDFTLEYTRNELGQAIRRWLVELTLHDPFRLGVFLSIHETSLKQLVLHDEELASFMLKHLTLETSLGVMSVDRLVERHQHLRFTQTLDEYRQVVGIVRTDVPVVNGGYIFDADIVRLLPSYFDVTVERIDVLSELDRLDPPPLDDRTLALRLEERASKIIEARDCAAVVRIMDRPDLPSLYVADPEVFRHLDRNRTQDVAGPGVWGDVISQVDSYLGSRHSHPTAGAPARLCLNWGNRLIRAIANLDDEAVFGRCIELLFIQSQLAAHRPLSIDDRTLMTSALSDLIALSTGLSDEDLRYG
ncbi:MAG: HSP90 family protein [Propionibacteriaceae bacterium]|jgi:molecular chaperone HtpG|nr:HSP90 family protein [Propionibacteriaceae bacterium]